MTGLLATSSRSGTEFESRTDSRDDGACAPTPLLVADTLEKYLMMTPSAKVYLERCATDT